MLNNTVDDINRKLRDLDFPPRWIQTLLIGILVFKDVLLPVLMTLVRGG